MANSPISVTIPKEAQQTLGKWLRLSRQNQMLTLVMLASKSGVPTMTLSRLEREGRGSLEAAMRALHALGELDAFNQYLLEQLRRASLPQDISQLEKPQRPKLRVRVKRTRDRP